VSAVKQMCEHPQLRFQWMRFLPPSTGYHINDRFWNGFVDLLKQQLLGAEIMVPHLGVGLQRSIKQVKEFAKTPAFYDQHGDPLFDDLDGQAAIYISERYKGPDLDLLRPYGLESLSIQDMMDRVWADSERGISKMRSSKTDDDWHSRAAKVLKYPFTSRLSSIIRRIRTMRLLPLDGGGWVSLNESGLPAYFPTTSNGTMIPPLVLDMRLIDPNAATHPDRRDFFLALGVKLATDDHIRSLILQKYQRCWLSLRASIAWIKFLYLTRPEKTESTAGYEDVSIVSSTWENLEPSKKDVYFPDDKSEYGAAKLGLEVSFLHADYLKDPPVRPGEQVSTAEESWKEWLHNAIGVRERLRLVASDGSAISDQVLHVAQHLPERFLGLLHHLWPHEGDKVRYSETIRSRFEKIEVLCDGGNKHPLHTTILPTPQLKALSSRFLKADEHLAFLELQQTHWEEKASGWEFLECLGVLDDDGLVFQLGMLRCIVTKTPSANRLKDSSRLLDLYKAIHGKCIASANLEQARETIRLVSLPFALCSIGTCMEIHY
jgi:hypothetical protein